MPKVSPSHQHARRDQILAAAGICFARHGFAATSMPDIATVADMSVGALYRYFASKEQLFLAVVAERVAVYNDAVFAELNNPGPALRRLTAALRSLQRLLRTQTPEDARLSLELWSRAHDVPELAAWLREARRRRVVAFRDVIDEAKLAGLLRSDVRPNDAAAALLAIADGLVVQRACAPFEHSTGHATNEAERLLKAWQSATVEDSANTVAPVRGQG
jgi:AcrR family transcriptional regulator